MSQTSSGAQLAPESKTLKLVEPQTLFDRINRIHENIARRAFEIFESEGSLFGRELDQWFKAEAELLHPVHMTMTETDGALTVQAEVPGFNASELEVSIEPRRLTISGKKETTKEEQKKGKVIYKKQCSSELLRIIDLPTEVDATKTTAMLKNGVLELNMPKGNAAKSARIDVKAA
ncbi:MAG: Hsp20 family protein [Candidatus Acidiferrales bacterium]